MALIEPTCAFCRIIAGEMEADIVHRDEDVVAFLDARPLQLGHTLVVPAAHVETLGELAPDRVAELMRIVQAASRAMESGLEAQGSFVAINNRVSQSVPHLHVHVVPRTQGDGLKGFFWPRRTYSSDEERREMADRVRGAIERELERVEGTPIVQKA